MTPEFSRPERLDTIGEGERRIAIEAKEGERAALARRFDLIAVESLVADLTVRRESAAIAVGGRVRASVIQACSATGVPLNATIDEPVALRFVEPTPAGEEEIELAADAIDTIEIEGSSIDLGEAAAETMALAIDPFVRSPDAAEVLRRAGVVGEDEVQLGPFGGLAALKTKLEGKNKPEE